MNQRRTKVGVLTNYNVFLVILRTARNQITLSSPVLRDSNLRVGLEEGFANDMSVWALLLALLLYAGQPDKIEEKADIWKALWVRSPGEEQDKSTKKRRRSWGGGDGNERSKKTGAGDENWGGTPAETGPEDGTEKVQHRIRCGSTPNPKSSAGWSVEMQPKVPPPTDHTFSNQPSMDEGHISFLGLSPSPSVRLSHCTPLSNANLHFHQTSRNVSQQTLLWFEERRFHLTNPVPSLSNIEANPWLSLDELIAEGPHFTTFSASAPDCLSPDADDLASSCSTEPDTFSAGSSAETHVNLTQPPATIDPPPRQYILKLARLFSPPHHTELGLASGSDIVSALELELRCYTNHLADLQGSIVPRFHGLWLSQSPGGQWAILLLEKVGLGGKQMRKWEELTKGES